MTLYIVILSGNSNSFVVVLLGILVCVSTYNYTKQNFLIIDTLHPPISFFWILELRSISCCCGGSCLQFYHADFLFLESLMWLSVMTNGISTLISGGANVYLLLFEGTVLACYLWTNGRQQEEIIIVWHFMHSLWVSLCERKTQHNQ